MCLHLYSYAMYGKDYTEVKVDVKLTLHPLCTGILEIKDIYQAISTLLGMGGMVPVAYVGFLIEGGYCFRNF